ncbi:hypothetical protein PoB_007613800 [Plakobranchus ocellatus]|uniref:Uncharacterized protein n=1 Tax=Plakobranchus ocellatus TaxID=259542 RepID=A0AAV4DZ46_9GAST|nr:hypothetical protein PoB_007613800 [Plakobranchus ocellatus]
MKRGGDQPKSLGVEERRYEELRREAKDDSQRTKGKGKEIMKRGGDQPKSLGGEERRYEDRWRSAVKHPLLTRRGKKKKKRKRGLQKREERQILTN